MITKYNVSTRSRLRHCLPLFLQMRFPDHFRGYKQGTLERNGLSLILTRVKVFKNWPSKICGRQPLKNLKWYRFPKHQIISSKRLATIFQEFSTQNLILLHWSTVIILDLKRILFSFVSVISGIFYSPPIYTCQ